MPPYLPLAEIMSKAAFYNELLRDDGNPRRHYGACAQWLAAVTPAIESLFLIAVDDDGVDKRCGHARQRRGGGRVEVDADRIHRILDDGVEGTREPGLIDVMSP
jgi:hypothetical protein